MTQQRLQLTWYNKDMALIPTEAGRYGYRWVEPDDPRYCETHTLVVDDYIEGHRSPKNSDLEYSERADFEPQFDNLLINGESGDVLEALTRVPELAKKYVGQVKLVYIDPPFNTAQTFASYEDNLEHSIWLTMMRDRLFHLKRLLSARGSIWVHLDSKEVHRMRLLLDEVFGSGNFIAEIAWEKTFKPKNDAKEGFSSRHDIILVYQKGPDFEWNRLPRTQSMDAAYSNPDNDERGEWTSAPATANHGDGAGGMCYAIQSPLTGELLRPPRGGSWRFGQDTFLSSLSEFAPYKLVDLHDEEWRAENEGVPYEKAKRGVKALLLDCDVEEAAALARKRIEKGNWPRIYLTGAGGFRSKSYLASKPGRVPEDWWPYLEVGSNDEAKSEIKTLFPTGTPFSTPKPERLLERILHIATNPGEIVLDCFAGSGTTAAVAQKMGRRWVTCELLESVFSSFTKPRLEKVVAGDDMGGITASDGERVFDSAEASRDDMTPDDAAIFTRLLNKLISNDDELKKSDQVRTLKKLAKTKKAKTIINWRGGGGFRVAHLSPECFDYDESLNRVTLTPNATGRTLVSSVAANLGFELLDAVNADGFDGRRGNMYLKVLEGTLTAELAETIGARADATASVTVAALSVADGAREALRKTRRGSKVVSIPDGIFPCAKGGVA